MPLITIASIVLPNWQHTITTVQLRVFADQSFRASDNTLIQRGSINDGGFYKAFTCTVNTSAKTITIPSSGSATLYSTRDSDQPSARYSAYFWDTTTDTLIQSFDDFVGFQLPAEPVSTTWDAIRTFNLAGIPVPIDRQTFSRTEILNLIANSASLMTGQLPIESGGTGAATAADARSNLSAAKSGANSDITSLTGLTTALSLSQGGTGANLSASAAGFLKKAAVGSTALTTASITASDVPNLENLNGTLTVAKGGSGAVTLTANGVLYGNGTSAIGATAAGATGTVLVGSTGAAPSFSATPTLTSITLTAALPITLSSAATSNKSVLFVNSSWQLVDDNANFYYESATSPVELNIKGRLRLRGTTGGTISLRSPATTTSSLSYDYTWPSDYGTSGYMLTTDGAGGLTWTPNAGTPGMGITSITAPTGGAQTGPAITFANGSSGTSFNIVGSANTITFNIPAASVTANGTVTTGTQSFNGAKTFTTSITTLGPITSSLGSGAPLVIASTDPVANLTLAADTQLPTISTAGKVSNSATTATTSNTANTIVLRDGSGNYTATLAGNVTGTVAVANGGTNITTYTLGNILYCSATNVLAKLTGNITTTRQFLSQTGTGAASAAPIWTALADTDIPSLNASKITTGTLTVARGGTGVGTLTGYVKGNGTSAFTAQAVPIPLTDGGTGGTTAQAAANSVLGFGSPATGDIFYYNGTNVTRLPIGSSNQVLTVTSGLPSWAGLGGGGGSITSVSGNDDILVTNGIGPAVTVGRTEIDTTASTRLYWLATPSGTTAINSPPAISPTGATTVDYFTFYLPMRLMFNKISVCTGATIGAGAAMTVAIYNTSGTRLGVTGTGALAGANTVQNLSLTSTLQLSPGFYVLGFNLAGSGPTNLVAVTYTTPTQKLISRNGAASTIGGGATAGVPNATVTFGAAEISITKSIPVFRLGS